MAPANKETKIVFGNEVPKVLVSLVGLVKNMCFNTRT
jgi:hypothetical protein